MIKKIFAKVFLLGVLCTLFYFVATHDSKAFNGLFDLPAVIMVLIAPLICLQLTSSDWMNLSALFQRIKEIKTYDQKALYADLNSKTQSLNAQFGLSQFLNWGERSPDDFLRYSSRIALSKYDMDQTRELLIQRMQYEDAALEKFEKNLSFLAKMAPYYGMVATVVGMVRVLRNLEDFTQISGHVGTAMLGTLYGLIAFAFLYSPLAKGLNSLRMDLRRRNEVIFRWVDLALRRQDSDFIEDNLKAQSNLRENNFEGVSH